VIDPSSNVVVQAVNLTSFDEDPRPPFRLVTGGVTPTHLAMVRKPLYHGAIDIPGLKAFCGDPLTRTHRVLESSLQMKTRS
jgi:hypothetical protein